jgi:hypothetical protein
MSRLQNQESNGEHHGQLRTFDLVAVYLNARFPSKATDFLWSFWTANVTSRTRLPVDLGPEWSGAQPRARGTL